MILTVEEVLSLSNRLREELYTYGPITVLMALAQACEDEVILPDLISEETGEELQKRRNYLRVSVMMKDLADMIALYPDVDEKEFETLKCFLGLKIKGE